MKKTTIIFLSVLSLHKNVGQSQTLTASNTNPVFGEVFIIKNCTYTNPGQAGAGKVWDFSNILLGPGASTFTILDPTTYTKPPEFAAANVSRSVLGVTHQMYIANTNTLESIGRYVSNYTLANLTYTNNETVLTYPFALGSSTIDKYAYKGQNNFIFTSGQKTITADATGTLITPCATYANVLRVRTVQLDSSLSTSSPNQYLVSRRITYNWYVPGIHFEILSMYTNSFVNKPSGATTKDSLAVLYNDPSNPLQIEEAMANKPFLLWFQNPAQNEIILNFNADLNEKLNLKLFNQQGSLVKEEVIIYSNNQGKLSVSDLPEGIYFMQVSNTNAIESRKVLIQH